MAFKKHKLILGISVGLAVSLSNLVFKASADEDWREVISGSTYYEIGGHSRIPHRRNRNFPLRGGLEWQNNVMCGNFDRSFSVSNILNGITGDLTKLMDDLIGSATGVISSWPWLEIARADPQLYEMLKEGRIGADHLFSASVSSCEAITRDIANNGSGEIEDWVQISGMERWRKESNDSRGKDLVNLDEEISRTQGDDSIEMPLGPAGGRSDPPIDVDKEAVYAGSNALAGRDVRNSSPWTSGHEDPPWYAEYWESPDHISEWLQEVVGSIEIRTCNDCDRMATSPGKGIYPIIEAEQVVLVEKITALVESRADHYDESQLKEISAPGFSIRSEVIEALKPERAQRRAYIELLAEEVALGRNVERLIAMRRILHAGRQNAHIRRYSPASEIVQQRLSELQNEMQMIKDDYEFRGIVRGSVARSLLNRLERDRSGLPQNVQSDMSELLMRLEELSQ